MTGSAPRAVGVRMKYDEPPARVRAWVDDVLGSPVVTTFEQVGGMSPGCATRVVTASGGHAFVKAVGPELNPMTPDLFRHEALVLTHLGANRLWAELLAVLDEPDGWVALILEDVPGRHPDLNDARDIDLLLTTTDQLAAALTGRAGGLEMPKTRDAIFRWTNAWDFVDQIPHQLLPGWVRERATEFQQRSVDLMDHADGNNVVQADIRDDNLIVRQDGTLVFVDWGMAARGPAWADPLLARIEWVEQSRFDDFVLSSAVLRDLGARHVTTYLVTLATFLAYRVLTAEDIGLPTLNEFRRTESARLLEGARRRLGIG